MCTGSKGGGRGESGFVMGCRSRVLLPPAAAVSGESTSRLSALRTGLVRVRLPACRCMNIHSYGSGDTAMAVHWSVRPGACRRMRGEASRSRGEASRLGGHRWSPVCCLGVPHVHVCVGGCMHGMVCLLSCVVTCACVAKSAVSLRSARIAVLHAVNAATAAVPCGRLTPVHTARPLWQLQPVRGSALQLMCPCVECANA